MWLRNKEHKTVKFGAQQSWTQYKYLIIGRPKKGYVYVLTSLQNKSVRISSWDFLIGKSKFQKQVNIYLNI